jgi:parallel beta-helix repeat protein
MPILDAANTELQGTFTGTAKQKGAGMPTITITNGTLAGKFTGTVTYEEATVPPVEPPPIDPPPVEPPPSGGLTTGDYYVATTGSDSNNGTSLNSPFKTINKAASVVSPGQTVLVKGGTYAPNVLIIDRPATAAQPVLFAPYGTDKVIIDGANSPTNAAFIQLNASYTTLQGFFVQNSRQNAIACWSATGAQVIGNAITGCVGTGVWCGGPSGGGSSNNLVKDNTITNCVLMNKDHSMGSAGGWGGGIGLQWTTGSQAIGNLVYENWGEGILIISGTNCKVIGNTVHDNYSVSILPDCAVNCEISNNFCYWSGDRKWGYLGNNVPDGIRLTREVNTIALDGLKVFNNIVVGCDSGISYRNYMAGGGVQNSKFYCNTLVNCAAIFEGSSGTRACEFKDNIIVGKAPSGSSAGLTCDYNCWDAGQGGGFAGAHDVRGNPGFVGQSGALNDKAYDLAATSPCKGKGVNLIAVVAKDYAGAARPASAAFSIGAYEG